MSEQNGTRLTGRATRGAAWLVGARLATKAIDFLSLIILARLLSPTEFGIVAVAMTLVFIVEAVLELPVAQVLVRLGTIEQRHLDTAFTLGALRGLILSGGLSLLAWPFSHFYDDPRLMLLIPILSLAPAMRSLVNPAMVNFVSRLDFRREFAVEVCAKVGALVCSTAAALIFQDYRAVVTGILTPPALMVIISYALVRYRPRLSLSEWPLFSGYLGWTTGAQLIGALNWQCDRLVLGRYVPHSALGEFSLANDLSYVPEQALVKPILRPLLSAYSLIGNDHQRLVTAYEKTATTVLAIGMPTMLGLSLLAQPAVAFALGSKWMAVVPILQWVSLTLIPPLLISPLGSLAMVKGRPDIFLRQSIAEASSKLPLVVLGAMFFGIPGVIFARAVSALLTAWSALYYVKVLIGVSILRQLWATWRVIASGGAMTLVLLALRPMLDGQTGPLLGLSLALLGLVGAASYILCLGLLWLAAGRPDGMEAVAVAQLRAIRAGRFRPAGRPA